MLKLLVIIIILYLAFRIVRSIVRSVLNSVMSGVNKYGPGAQNPGYTRGGNSSTAASHTAASNGKKYQINDKDIIDASFEEIKNEKKEKGENM